MQRFLKFSKFLPEFGWQPTIVTVANGSYPYLDETLLSEVNPNLKVYRTKTFEPFELYNMLQGKKGKALPVVSVGGGAKKKSFFQKLSEYIRGNFFVPDARVGWVKHAIRQADELLRNEQFDAIVTTGPPHSTHLIGLDLKGRHKLKWIADFRDPWTGIFYNDILPRTEATKKKDLELETKVLQNADCVTVISPGMQQEFESRCKKLAVVFNGYDEEEFGKAKIATNKDFTIRYVGNLMASQNPENLWKAIAQLSTSAAIKVELVGRVDEEVKRSIEASNIGAMVSYISFVEHAKAINLMEGADLLLFAIPKVNGANLILTGKLFEYLASRSEMISFGPVDGNASEILRETGRKPMLNYEDEQGTMSQLKTAIEFYNSNKQGLKYGGSAHTRYSRKNQTAALVKLLQ